MARILGESSIGEGLSHLHEKLRSILIDLPQSPGMSWQHNLTFLFNVEAVF